MTDTINALAAAAAASTPGSRAYTYSAEGALTARILVIEDGGQSFPDGEGIGGATETMTHHVWGEIMMRAGYRPGMWSWWNAIPYGLQRANTAEDRIRGSKYVRRAVDLHEQLEVVIAIGTEAKKIVTSSPTGPRLYKTRSPVRSGHTARQDVVDLLVRARLDAYPAGF